MISITRSIVAPTQAGPPRGMGVMRKTLIEADRVVQLFYLENAKGKYGRLVTRRVITERGFSWEQTFDSPLLEKDLPAIVPLRFAVL